MSEVATISSGTSKTLGRRLRAAGVRYGVYAAAAASVLVAGLIEPTFLSPSNLANLAMQLVPLAIVVLGQMLVILMGGLDLSVASVMATAAVVGTCFSGQNRDAPAIFVVALAIGASVGLVNGFLVTKRRVSPFLATLASMIVLQGLRFAWTKGAPTGAMPPLFQAIGSGKVHGVPIDLAVLFVFGAIVAFVVHATTLGRRMIITGGNPATGRLLGFPVDGLAIGAYVASGVLASCAGLVLGGYSGIVDNWVGRGFELDSIVACVIGGVALSGGRGTVGGALAGAAVMILVSNLVLLLGLPVQFQIIIKGLVIVGAAAIYVKR